jgi:hypothetical protein
MAAATVRDWEHFDPRFGLTRSCTHCGIAATIYPVVVKSTSTVISGYYGSAREFCVVCEEPWEIPDEELDEQHRFYAEQAMRRIMDHIDTMYPAMWTGVATSVRRSLQKTIILAVREALAQASD